MKLKTLIALMEWAHRMGYARGIGQTGSGRAFVAEAFNAAAGRSNDDRRSEDIGAVLAMFGRSAKDDASVIE